MNTDIHEHVLVVDSLSDSSIARESVSVLTVGHDIDQYSTRTVDQLSSVRVQKCNHNFINYGRVGVCDTIVH